MPAIRRLGQLGPELVDPLCDLLLDAVAGGASIGFMAHLDRAEAAGYWQGLAESLEQDVLCWVAEDAGRLLGSVQLGLCHKANGRHRAELQKLMVHRSARGRGIGSALLDVAERAAGEQGRFLLVLDTEAGSGAEALYRRRGWQPAGQIPDYARSPDGRLHPTALYWKRLHAPAGQASLRPPG
ncbi:GNAT family N-acetyltransferase [Pseudomarimonas salicorniae]|uniref:GNAT family N-acetyltransferase n=1 Tax=Pseudomarimonas salicorniae TaxID=2933270 RepID=A0ABT0GCU7_9GAMM|nr:GNAT family N-acetyltransferase [Lysobacter sp. CAU 1642]MCK7592358.1 GNAT family N-acetyltransferase [Lysobacter sp. CAU 1642]